MRPATRVVLGLLVVATFAPQARAAEPWADKNLPVTDGLALWLDATRIGPATEAAGAAPPRAGGAVAVWHDASGNKRDARQDAPGRRPQFRTDLTPSQSPTVQFDGRDD